MIIPALLQSLLSRVRNGTICRGRHALRSFLWVPSTDLRHVYIQVTMASPQRIDAIIIPYDGSIPYVVDFLLVVPGSSHIDINDCLEEEEELGLIPNIWVPDRHYQEFNWELRSIAFIPASDIENHIAEPGITYMMYTSRDEEAGTYRKCSCAKKSPSRILL